MGHFGHQMGVNIAVAAEVVKWFTNVGAFGVKALSVALLR